MFICFSDISPLFNPSQLLSDGADGFSQMPSFSFKDEEVVDFDLNFEVSRMLIV
jgi:hypothetical protein